MQSHKFNFDNGRGQLLSARLDLPADQYPHNYAIFAHCFTCSKDFSAARNICRALASEGFGVLRFDFSGLNKSEGDFSDTNFSTNVQDIIAASEYLTKNYKAPSLLIGHSLGGAAVLFAGSEIESVKAVTTIGAPSNPSHVQKQLGSVIDTIKDKGVADISLAGRPFTFKKQFVDNLESLSCANAADKLRDEALLIFHSPQDSTVSIKNAEEIYMAAHHPKSFVTLDGAEHLLIDKNSAAYVGQVIAGWAARYLPITEEEEINTTHQVVASLDGDDGFTTEMKLGSHYFRADEPERMGGNNFGPTPYELLAGSLSACTAMTIQMYAQRKGWPIKNVQVHTSYSRTYAHDCVACENDPSNKIDTFTRVIKLEADLDEEQRARILKIADKCPVHKTLHTDTQVLTTYEG